MKKLICGIDHVCIKCVDYAEYEKTTDFYKNVLGLEVLRTGGTEDAPSIVFDTGAGGIEIFTEAETDLPQGAIRHFALRTEDVDACVDAVRNAGYEITTEPKNMELECEPPVPIRIAFCIGPVGEEIEFYQVRSKEVI